VNPGAAVRADAARGLAAVVFDGVSLRPALAEANAAVPDPRDRALMSALLLATTRWWLRYDAVQARLLERRLPTGAREIRCLLALGLVQMAVLGLPAHAVVAASVDAVRTLGRPRHAGLVNALLRRYLRERDGIEADLDRDPVTRTAHPRWLIDAIGRDWPDVAEDIFEADNREAPLTLRVNRRRCGREALCARLADAGIEADAHPALPDAVVLGESTDVRRLPGYAEGWFSVQDGAAQYVAECMDVASGQRILDACAAPGGKSAHLLERADIELLALDRDPARLARMTDNLARLGLAAQLVAADAGRPETWWDGRAFDRILLDAPCSASGILRRQPDVRLHRRAADLAPLVASQAGLLAALWPLLAPGGRLVYATCSLLRAENQQVIEGFLATEADARSLPLPDNAGVAAGPGRQRLPGTGGMDGFYYAVVEKMH
jgi:16S rRNA (cytosine967-C5)-methyltransferase